MIRAAIVVVLAMLTFCQTASAGMRGRNACTEDVQKFCNSNGEHSQRVACLKANWSKLSPDCKAMFKHN